MTLRAARDRAFAATLTMRPPRITMTGFCIVVAAFRIDHARGADAPSLARARLALGSERRRRTAVACSETAHGETRRTLHGDESNHECLVRMRMMALRSNLPAPLFRPAARGWACLLLYRRRGGRGRSRRRVPETHACDFRQDYLPHARPHADRRRRTLRPRSRSGTTGTRDARRGGRRASTSGYRRSRAEPAGLVSAHRRCGRSRALLPVDDQVDSWIVRHPNAAIVRAVTHGTKTTRSSATCRRDSDCSRSPPCCSRQAW